MTIHLKKNSTVKKTVQLNSNALSTCHGLIQARIIFHWAKYKVQYTLHFVRPQLGSRGSNIAKVRQFNPMTDKETCQQPAITKMVAIAREGRLMDERNDMLNVT